MARNEIEGMRELERSIRRLGRVPQAIATKAARAGAVIAFRAAKNNAPVDTGNLKGGIILKGERRVKVGKKVYDIMMDPAKNNVFVKTSAEGKRSYYPASQEYGYMTADGGYIPGFQYLRKAITENARSIERKVVEAATKAVDKALSER
jgi:hypothetical protein